MNSVKFFSTGRSLVLDLTTTQSKNAVVAITTQKMMFLTAEFTATSSRCLYYPTLVSLLPPDQLDASERSFAQAGSAAI